MLFKTSNIHEITKEKESIDTSRVVHQEILNTLQLLGNSEWSCEKDIKQLVNNNLNFFEKKLSGECLRIPLHFMSKDSRSILLPFSTSSVLRFNEIWLAVIITSVRHMQELDLIILKKCLKEMKNLYLDNDPSSLEASYDIPRRALIKSLNTF